MTGTFQIRKQNDGGVQELINASTNVEFDVNYPVSFDTDGTLTAYASGAEIFGVNNTEFAAPEFFSQDDLDDIATTALTVLVSPVKSNSLVEVLSSVSVTDEDTMKGYIGSKVDFNASLAAVLGTAGTDAQVMDYKVYTATDGTLTINPIVKFLSTVY